MTHLDASSPGPPPRAGNGHDEALVAEARRLVTETKRPYGEIAEEIGVPRGTVSKWQSKHGWPRPEGAPEEPAHLKAAREARGSAPAKAGGGRAERLIARLYKLAAKEIGLIEERLGKKGAHLEEKDARALGSLARTLGTLMALERDDGAKKTDPDAVDPDEIRARLARRLYALGRSGE